MKLEQYLEGIKNCPDEIISGRKGQLVHRLTEEFGVYDNYSILLRLDFEELLTFLKSKDFTIVEDLGRYRSANYNPGTVFLQLFDEVPIGSFSSETSFPEHYQRQVDFFSVSMMLHPYQEKKQIKEISWQKVLANIIEIVGRYAIDKKVSLCLPDSIGWNDLGNADKIIYHP